MDVRPLAWLAKPKWILGHLLIVAIVCLCLWLASWQLDRLHGREASNRSIRSAMDAAPLVVMALPLPGDAADYQRVSVSGTWDPAGLVYKRYPIREGRPGYEVLEPLRLDGGGVVVVDRGWIPVEQGKPAARPPSAQGSQGAVGSSTTTGQISTERVVVEGLLRTGERAGAKPGANEGAPGVPTVSAVDLGQLAALMNAGGELAPFWVQATEAGGSASPAIGQPAPLDPPELGNGPHLSYALQWLSFAAIAIIGWFAVLWRTAKDQRTLAGNEEGTPDD